VNDHCDQKKIFNIQSQYAQMVEDIAAHL
jgi:hypothetical protein